MRPRAAVVPAPEHVHSAEQVSRVTQVLLSVDWHKSIYHGVDRRVAPVDDVPTQVKLSFIPNGMAVAFATQYAYPAGSAPEVMYGTSESNLDLSASGVNGQSYGTDWFHVVLLEDLPAATKFFYQVVGDSAVYSFTTALATGDETPFSLVMVGDMGLSNSANTMLQMNNAANQTNFFMHIGDLSYADDFYLRSGDTYEGSWNKVGPPLGVHRCIGRILRPNRWLTALLFFVCSTCASTVAR